MDDLKVAHVNSFEDTKFAGYMTSIYGGLTKHKEKRNYYLVIDLDYSKQGKVNVSMIKFLYGVLHKLPDFS